MGDDEEAAEVKGIPDVPDLEEDEPDMSYFDDDDEESVTDSRTYYHRGNECYEKEDYDRAIENYNMAIVLNPNFSEAYFNRGLSYYNKKNYDKAISDYNKSADLDPRNPVIYNNRGDAFYRKQEFDNAILDYDKAISLNPKYLKAFYNRGLAYACQQDYEKAIEDFNKVIELNPEFAEAYHIRGLAFDYMQDYTKAIADYDKAIELKPDFQEAVNHRELAKSKMSGTVDASGQPVTSTEGGQTVNAIKLLQKPKISFNEVAGLDRLKELINDSIVYPLLQPELARRYGKLGGGGIMFYGPPGCGKTYVVKAAAGECKASFINAKISDIMDMYVGNTEKNLHNIFETGRKNAPCVIFFDEMEALGARRDQMQQQPYQKMAVNQLLYEMDGLEAKNEDVLVIGATNAPWDVDPALRRSGRFSKHMFVPEPDKKSREALFKLHAKNKPTKGGVRWGRLARATVGYAAADIKQLCDDAASIPWKEAFKSGKERPVEMKDFIKAIKKRKSSLPPWYESAKKQIGTQEEKSIVDGKEHLKVTESKLAAGEKEQFKELLDVIKHKNKWWVKYLEMAQKYFALYLF